MLLCGTVTSVEAKGYLLDLHFADRSQAFLKSKLISEELEVGQRVQICIKKQKNKEGLIQVDPATPESLIG